jgi:hypothetical protein
VAFSSPGLPSRCSRVLGGIRNPVVTLVALIASVMGLLLGAAAGEGHERTRRRRSSTSPTTSTVCSG